MTAEDDLVSSMPNGDNDLNNLIENSLRQYASNPCLGTRDKKMEDQKDDDGNIKSKEHLGFPNFI